LDRPFFPFVCNYLVSIGHCPVAGPVAWDQLEGQLMKLVWDSIDFPGGFYCVTSNSLVSKRQEILKAKKVPF
jgi:hypothetical protein